jgi:hypothetical protein
MKFGRWLIDEAGQRSQQAAHFVQQYVICCKTFLVFSGKSCIVRYCVVNDTKAVCKALPDLFTSCQSCCKGGGQTMTSWDVRTACLSGDAQRLRELLACDAPCNDLDYDPEIGLVEGQLCWRPIHHAARNNHVECVSMLLDHHGVQCHVRQHHVYTHV